VKKEDGDQNKSEKNWRETGRSVKEVIHEMAGFDAERSKGMSGGK
jgi:hypothetical protein